MNALPVSSASQTPVPGSVAVPSPCTTALPPAHFYKEESYESTESVGYLMRRAVTTVGQEIERQLEASDLTNAQ